MKLKDFIISALVEICEGIAEAKAKTIKNGSCPIAPGTITDENGKKEQGHGLQNIDFEVCVTIDNSENNSTQYDGKIGGGILKVVSAELNADKTVNTKNNTVDVQKISFSVPFLPQAVRSSENTKN